MSDHVRELEERLAETTDLRATIDLLNDLAWEVRDTDPVRSLSLSETALRRSTSAPFEAQPYREGWVKSLRGLAHSNRRAGNLSVSLSQSMDALAFLESAPIPDVTVDILRNVTIILGSLGNYAEALESGLKALRLAQSAGDRIREAAVLGSMGVVYVHAKHGEESLRTFRQVLQINRELGQTREEALTLNNQSLAFRAVGDNANALAASLEALRLAKESGFGALVVTATGTVGESYLASGEAPKACEYFDRYLTAARSAGSKRDEAWALMLLGETHVRRSSVASARECLARALEITQEVGLRSEEARCRKLLADLHEKQGDLAEALAQFRLYHELSESIFSEQTASRIANLQVIRQVEMARRDAEIQYLKTIELQREIEERKKSQRALEELAAIDPLTGAFNRRQFLLLAEQEIREAAPGRRPVTLIMVDVDHFKSINDRHGHSIGDRVLTEIAHLIRESLRKGEAVCRMGGDEFAILLPRTSAAQGQLIAQRVLEKVVSCPFQGNGGSFSVTASFGVAEVSAAVPGTLEMLVDRADKAVYAAKRSGRNRVSTCASPMAGFLLP
ncbi:MAG TPA: diguanylate cyclase [Spirochaetia bacterium]|nr:diguanylate cyclase [Spirochaetia bacterium]